jgi:hypothetical protein
LSPRFLPGLGHGCAIVWGMDYSKRKRAANGTFRDDGPHPNCLACGKPVAGRTNRYCSRICYLSHHGAGPKRKPFWNRIAIGGADECWPWTDNTTAAGYGHLSIGGRVHLAHRVAWEIANGKIPEGAVIRHSCDNPPCCNPSHLMFGSHRDNTADMLARNRNRPPIGERNGRGKLTAAQVAEIRRLAPSFRGRYRALGAQFGVNVSTISAISRGCSWTHTAT